MHLKLRCMNLLSMSLVPNDDHNTDLLVQKQSRYHVFCPPACFWPLLAEDCPPKHCSTASPLLSPSTSCFSWAPCRDNAGIARPPPPGHHLAQPASSCGPSPGWPEVLAAQPQKHSVHTDNNQGVMDNCSFSQGFTCQACHRFLSSFFPSHAAIMSD